MAELFYVSTEHTFHVPHAIHTTKVRHLTALAPLIKTFFQRRNDEHDVHGATVVVLHTTNVDATEAPQTGAKDKQSKSPGFSELDTLTFAEKVLLLRYFFSHLNLIVVSTEDLANASAVAELNGAIAQIAALIENRISRVATWTGTGTNINDEFGHVGSGHVTPPFDVADVVATMSFLVYRHANVDRATHAQLVALKNVLLRTVDFRSLLHDHSTQRRRQLCHLVGHWAFPAHELSNDDLVYCVHVMVDYALGHVRSQLVPSGFEFPTENELLAMVYMVRDTYNSGNPFHNFRHAVDVLQACFHFLVRLGCLPEFEQLEIDPRGSEGRFLDPSTPTNAATKLVARPEGVKSSPGTSSAPLLSPLQSLGLLIAALGHDVGHPGVTNAFMIKHGSPTARLFGERSVLESFHASVFVNKILAVNWPSFLATETADERSPLSLKTLVINSILATDMAEHFEYISRLNTLELGATASDTGRVKLICSLLIKCADISNVTRPLRVSSQWASVLSQEFSEVDSLEHALQQKASVFGDVSYPPLPSELAQILAEYPNIHKGQIFFIQTFADGLFNSIVKHFPELQYTAEIIAENNQFWSARVEQLQKSG